MPEETKETVIKIRKNDDGYVFEVELGTDLLRCSPDSRVVLGMAASLVDLLSGFVMMLDSVSVQGAKK